MLELMGPSSITCAPKGAINLPSEVPPEVDNFGVIPVIAKILSAVISTSSPLLVINGSPLRLHFNEYLKLYLFKIDSTRDLSSLAVTSVEKRKLKDISADPGIILVAPVPL